MLFFFWCHDAVWKSQAPLVVRNIQRWEEWWTLRYLSCKIYTVLSSAQKWLCTSAARWYWVLLVHLASAPISISLGCPNQCTGFDFCCLFSRELPPPPFGAVTHFLVLLISSCLLPELMVCCSPPQQQNLVEKQVKLSRCRKISFSFFFFSSARHQPSVSASVKLHK